MRDYYSAVFEPVIYIFDESTYNGSAKYGVEERRQSLNAIKPSTHLTWRDIPDRFICAISATWILSSSARSQHVYLPQLKSQALDHGNFLSQHLQMYCTHTPLIAFIGFGCQRRIKLFDTIRVISLNRGNNL